MKRNKDGFYLHKNEWYVLDTINAAYSVCCFPDTKETKITLSVKLKDLKRAVKDAEKRDKKGLLGLTHLNPNVTLCFTDAKPFTKKRSK